MALKVKAVQRLLKNGTPPVVKTRGVLFFISGTVPERYDVSKELVRHKHILRVKCLIEFLLCHQSLLEHDIIDRTVSIQCFLGHFGRCLVAYVGIQGCDDTDRVLHHLQAAFLVHSDAQHALFRRN